MRLGIQQSAVNPADIEKSFVMASRADAEGVGINVASMKDMIDLGRHDYAVQLRRLAAGYDLEIPNLHLGCLCEEPSLIGKRREVGGGKAAVRMGLWVAAEAGISTVIVPFFGRNRMEFPHEQRRAEQALSDLAKEAELVGVKLAIEADLHAEQLGTLVDTVDSKMVQVAINTGQICARRLDLPGIVLGLGVEMLAQVQMKDVMVVSRMSPQFNVRLGRGSVDFMTLMRALRAIKFDGWLNVDAPPGDEDGAIVAANLAYARTVMNGGNWVLGKLGRITRLAAVEEPVQA